MKRSTAWSPSGTRSSRRSVDGRKRTCMEPRDIARELFHAAGTIPEPFSSLSEEQRQAARRLMARFEEAEATCSGLPHGDLLHAMLLSKNGRYDEALALTERRYRQAPGWETAVAVANAARRAGDLERAA